MKQKHRDGKIYTDKQVGRYKQITRYTEVKQKDTQRHIDAKR